MSRILSLSILLIFLTACGVGAQYDEGHPSDEDKTTLGSNWDKMKWDKGKWK